MEESDRLSATAIVVALLALFVALGQTLQQYLATADGLRRCKNSVIGPWGNFTWLRWSWYEFRYETIYTTPEIVLLLPGESETRLEREAPLLGQPLLRQKHDIQILEKVNLRRHFQSANCHPRRLFMHLRANPWSKIFNPSWRLATGREAVEQSVHPKDNKSFPNDLTVTWVQLIRHLHDMYSNQWPGDCQVGAASCAPRDSVGQRERRTSMDMERGQQSSCTHVKPEEKADPADVKQRENSTRTDVYVFLRERSWDFMPSDIVRPLATIRTGSLTILAMRLGMQWRVLRHGGDSGIQADGNGYSLTSSLVRGLGTVIQFTYDKPNKTTQNIIPSSAADMMMCGILPTCSRLFKAESGGQELSFNLIGDDRKASQIWTLVNLLKLSDENIQMFRDNYSDFKNKDDHRGRPFSQPVLNDVLSVMMPFLPLQSSASVDVLFNGWLGQVQSSIFHYWAARRALLVNLRNEVNSRNQNYPSSHLKDILKYFTDLEKDYFGDFYLQESTACIYGGYRADHMRTAANFEGSNTKNVKARRLEMLKALRDIHQVTTKYFERLNNPSDEHSVMPQLKYMDLLTAHANMAYTAGRDARKTWFREEGFKERKYLYDLHERGPPRMYLEMYVQVCFYVEHLDRVVDEIKLKGCAMASRNVREAWWMLMLRGVVWDMSIWCTPLDVPVPASFYSNQTPLWIT